MFQYSADDISISWLGLGPEFDEGLASGSFFTDAPATPSYSTVTLKSGKKVRVGSTDTGGVLTMVVAQESKLHQQLRAINKLDTSTARNKVANLLLSDSSGYKVNYKNTFISAKPGEPRGTETGPMTWTFEYEEFDDTPNEDLQNKVGN